MVGTFSHSHGLFHPIMVSFSNNARMFSCNGISTLAFYPMTFESLFSFYECEKEHNIYFRLFKCKLVYDSRDLRHGDIQKS